MQLNPFANIIGIHIDYVKLRIKEIYPFRFKTTDVWRLHTM